MLGILSFEQIISEYCKSVIVQNDDILFVSAINKNGRIIYMAKKDDSILSTLTKHEADLVFMQRVLQMLMMRDFDDKLGKIKIAMIEREHFTECLFPFYDGVFLVFSNSAGITKTCKNILLQIQKITLHTKTVNLLC